MPVVALRAPDTAEVVRGEGCEGCDWPRHTYYAIDKDSGGWEPAVRATWYTRHQGDSSSTFKVVKRRRVAVHCKQLVPVDISTFDDWTGSRSASSGLIKVSPEVDVVIKKMNLVRFRITTQTV